MKKIDCYRKPKIGVFNRAIIWILAGLIMGFFQASTVMASEIEPKDVISPESIRVHHQALVDIATRAGGLDSGIRLNKAGDDAAKYLLEGFKNAGLKNVRFEPFYPNRWWPESYDFTLLGDSGLPDQKMVTFPLWHCEKADNLELEVVYAGFGTAGEFKFH